MCFTGLETSDVWAEMVVCARKTHRCDECFEDIRSGEFYLRIGCLYDGHWDTLRVCARCEWDRERVRLHEIAEGCAEHEAVCPIGYLREHMADLHQNATRFDDDDNEIRTADWSPSPITYRGELA